MLQAVTRQFYLVRTSTNSELGKKKLIQNIPEGLSKDEISDIAIKCLIKKGMYQNQVLKKIVVIPNKVVNLVI